MAWQKKHYLRYFQNQSTSDVISLHTLGKPNFSCVGEVTSREASFWSERPPALRPLCPDRPVADSCRQLLCMPAHRDAGVPAD